MLKFFSFLVFFAITGCLTSSPEETDSGQVESCESIMAAWIELSNSSQFDSCLNDDECTYHKGSFGEGFCDGGGGLWSKEGVAMNITFEADALILNKKFDELLCYNPETDFYDGSRPIGKAICYSGKCGPSDFLHCGAPPSDAGIESIYLDAGVNTEIRLDAGI